MVAALLVLLGSLLNAPAQAQTYFLNFDTDFNGNAIANNTPVSAAYSIPGITFSANSIILTGGGGVSSQPNFASGTPLYNGVFGIDFASSASSVSAINVSNSDFTLTAFDASNNVIGTSHVSNFLQQASVNAPGIKKVTFSTQSQYGIDDLRIQLVPEGDSMAMLACGGLPFVFLVIRKSRTRKVS